MKAADLDRARDLIAQRAATERLLGKLEAAEPLRLTVGTGGEAAEIVLARSFLDTLRADLVHGLRQRSEDLAASLVRLGVEP